MADNQHRIDVYMLEQFAAQQLGTLFSSIKKDHDLETSHGRKIRVDIFAQSISGQVILFEVKHVTGRGLGYSDFLPAIVLRDAVNNLFIGPSNMPPVVVMLTDGEVGSSVATASKKSGIPIVKIADHASDTARRLNEEFQRFGILLPEMVTYGSPSLAAYSVALLAEVDRVWRRAGNYSPSWRQVAVLPKSQLKIPEHTFQSLFPGTEIPLEEIAHGFPLLGLDLGQHVYNLGPQGWIGIIPVEPERPPAFLWVLRQDCHFAYREVLWEESNLSITRGHTHIGSLLQIALATTFFMKKLISRADFPKNTLCQLQIDLHGMKNRGVVVHPAWASTDALVADNAPVLSSEDSVMGSITTSLGSIDADPVGVGYDLVGKTIQFIRPDLVEHAALEKQLRVRHAQDCTNSKYRYLGFLDKEMENRRG